MRAWLHLGGLLMLTACTAPVVPSADPPGSVRIEGKSATPGCGQYGHVCEAKVHGVDGKSLGRFDSDAIVEAGPHVVSLICRIEYDPAAANSALQRAERHWSTRVIKVNLRAGVRYKVKYVVDADDCKLSLIEKETEREVQEIP